MAAHRRAAREFLATARLAGIPEGSRFINLYEAAHAVALAGLKLAGYRPKLGDGGRSVVLQLVEETLALRKGAAAAFAEANRLRNEMLYGGSAVDVPDVVLESLESAIEEGIREVEVRMRSL